MLDAIITDPVIPIYWGANQKGMQTGNEIELRYRMEAERIWLDARDYCVTAAEKLSKLKVHKSLVNRLTEPWMWITVVMTATTWKNFFDQRCHPDAEIHFQKIAGMMKEAVEKSKPNVLVKGDYLWHLPYIEQDDFEEVSALNYDKPIETLKLASVARCARVSYVQHGEKAKSLDKDVELAHDLINGSGELGHRCYDSETDVLTNEGWKNWTIVTGRESFATLNLGTNQIEYQQAVNTNLNQPYKGTMVKVVSGTKTIDLLVTPNHNMLACVMTSKEGRKKEKFQLIEAGYLHAVNHCYLKNTIPYQLSGHYSFDYLELIGFALGDANVESNWLCFHLKKERKIQYLNNLCDRLKLEVKQHGGDKYRVEWSPEFGLYENGEKCLPQNLVMEEDNYPLYVGLMNSDGCDQYPRYTFHTTSVKLMNQFCQICFHCGFPFSISNDDEYKQNENHKRKYKIEILRKSKPEVNRIASYDSKTEFVQYNGLIHCVTVPNKTLYVRRNGVPVWSGNSPFEHVAEGKDDPKYRSGPFQGWNQLRKDYWNE